jgi:hypothetical protein
MAASLAVLLPHLAAGQVLQQGGVVAQHFTMWSSNNAVMDAGGSGQAPRGLQPFEWGVVSAPNLSGSPFPATATGKGPNGENGCFYDAPAGIGGHYLCFSPNVGSNTGAITFGSIGGGAAGGFEFIINGTKVPFPGPGIGTVVGPATSVVGNLSCWNNTGGTVLSDCGVAASAILTQSTAAATYLTQSNAAILYAPLAGPAFTGVPTAPTAAPGTATTQLATTAFVTSAVTSNVGANKLLNPFFEIDQANEGAAISVNSGSSLAYAIDGWVVACASPGSGVVSGQRVADAPVGYTYSLKATATTAGAISSGTACYFEQRVEQSDLADTALGTNSAQSLSVSFWVKASLTGTYSAALRNGGSNRSYVQTFVINTANVWQQTSFTLPGDTAGTWVLAGNGIGMVLDIVFSAGTTYQGVANTWQAGNVLTTSAINNGWLTTLGATFQISAAKLELGGIPTKLQRVSIESELERCQRYYEKSYDLGTAVGTVTQTGASAIGIGSGTVNSIGAQTVTYKVTKRVDPAGTMYSTATGATGKARDNVNNVDVPLTVASSGMTGFFWYAQPSTGGSINLSMQWISDARL